MPWPDGQDKSFKIKSALIPGEFLLPAKGQSWNETWMCFRKLTKMTND